MFGFIKKIFLTGLTVLSNLVSTTPLSCISINNQECNHAINNGIATYFVYYKYTNHNKENVSKYDYVYQSKN